MDIQIQGKWYYFKNMHLAKEFFKDDMVTKLPCCPIFKHRLVENHRYAGAYVLATPETHKEIEKVKGDN